MTRRALLVGSMPYDNEIAAMTTAIDLLGDRLVLGLPDGEIGERSEAYPRGYRAAWIQAIVDDCERDTYAFRVLKRAVRNEIGVPVDYEHGVKLAPRLSPSTLIAHLDFRWLDYFMQSFSAFRGLREERGLDALRFQVGLPTGLGMTFSMMRPLDAVRYSGSFNVRMAVEANQILKIAGADNVVFQLEVPGDLALAYKLPKPLATQAVRGVLDLVNAVKPGAPFGVHLCFGDLNNEALIKAGSIERAVLFTNALVKAWPRTHELSYIHFPLAEAAAPPTDDPAYYAPLAKLALPSNVRLVAGFVHDRLDEEEHRRRLDIIERAHGGSVDVAASCGLGRRTAAEADHMIAMTRALTEA